MPISRSACDLGKVCAEALDSIRAGWPEQLFAEQISGDLILQADAARLHQALSNLLSNAVQHGDRKAPVTLCARGEADAVVLQVSNAGEPIPPDALQLIFEPLVQATSANTLPHERQMASLGLGLFIVREIVLGHGGSVTVESSAEAGTVFTVRLPRVG
jgi:signal transduction histidine kinase